MSHAAIHIALGMFIASLFTLPGLRRAWLSNAPLARPCAIWLLASYAAGLFAIVPSLLSHIGLPVELCRGWWMNIFLFHPFIRSLNPGGKAVGTAMIGAAFASQYLLLMLMIRFRSTHTLTSP